MVVHQLLLTPAEQADHFARGPLAPRVAVASAPVHELPVGVPHRARAVQQRLALGHALAPRAVLPERKEAVRHAEPEAARAEMHADPDAVGLVGEHVHVVVAAADRAELAPRLGAQPVALGAVRQGFPRRVLEQRVVRGRVVGMGRSEEHTSELQSLAYLVCRLLLEKKKTDTYKCNGDTM